MFTNEPPLDFSIPRSRTDFQAALDALDQEILGKALWCAPIIAGRALRRGEVLPRRDPSDSSITLGGVHAAGAGEVQEALGVLQAGAKLWAAAPFETRADTVQRAGDLLAPRRLAFAALMVREAGKPWQEADLDVVEAIDYARYYAEEMRRLGPPRLTAAVLGETNHYLYQPRGIAAVISPWNFPLAITAGMSLAALVAGNAVALKPSGNTSLLAHRFAELLLEAGIPAEAFALLPGPGSVLGRALVESPFVDLIAFTGSKGVGLEILEKAARVQPQQRSIKRVIAELGGKNALIIDDDADIDEAGKAALYSAFGYAGQKCSACSRIIGVGAAYEEFLERFCSAAGDLIVGEARDPATFIGPLIDEASRERVSQLIHEGGKEQRLAFMGGAPDHGCYVPAAVFRDVDTSSPLWRREIFGPVVCCRKARSFAEALALADDCEYALTGGVFSRNPAHIAEARSRFTVGNLYINRGMTGAVVCRQPFGGFRMSGVGSKSGGPDYLLQFMEPRTITENTTRRGAAPELM